MPDVPRKLIENAIAALRDADETIAGEWGESVYAGDVIADELQQLLDEDDDG